jgi:hypothetical protein
MSDASSRVVGFGAIVTGPQAASNISIAFARFDPQYPKPEASFEI